MTGLREAVTKFLAERDNFITAIKNCPADESADYWRWQGHAEARRVFREGLERDGIDLAAEPAPVASPEALVNLLELHGVGHDALLPTLYRSELADALLAAGVFRDEATVKAEALEEALASGAFPGLTLARDWIASRAKALRAGTS